MYFRRRHGVDLHVDSDTDGSPTDLRLLACPTLHAPNQTPCPLEPYMRKSVHDEALA